MHRSDDELWLAEMFATNRKAAKSAAWGALGADANSVLVDDAVSAAYTRLTKIGADPGGHLKRKVDNQCRAAWCRATGLKWEDGGPKVSVDFESELWSYQYASFGPVYRDWFRKVWKTFREPLRRYAGERVEAMGLDRTAVDLVDVEGSHEELGQAIAALAIRQVKDYEGKLTRKILIINTTKSSCRDILSSLGKRSIEESFDAPVGDGADDGGSTQTLHGVVPDERAEKVRAEMDAGLMPGEIGKQEDRAVAQALAEAEADRRARRDSFTALGGVFAALNKDQQWVLYNLTSECVGVRRKALSALAKAERSSRAEGGAGLSDRPADEIGGLLGLSDETKGQAALKTENIARIRELMASLSDDEVKDVAEVTDAVMGQRISRGRGPAADRIHVEDIQKLLRAYEEAARQARWGEDRNFGRDQLIWRHHFIELSPVQDLAENWGREPAEVARAIVELGKDWEQRLERAHV